ncbi:MAG: glycosyltransferase [Chitinivibrionales bacterium]|nr:glycosyltransferase [Chitinivibrionales bacterium]
MKICIVSSVFPRTNDDLEVPWLREIVRRCRAAGADVRVYAPSFRALRSHTIDGIPVHRFRYFFGPWETLTHEEGAPNKVHKLHYKLISAFYIVFGSLGLIRLHLRERFDILHVHWPFPHTFFALAARLFRPARLMLNFYGADLLLMRKYGFVKRYLERFIDKADRVVAISRFTAGQVRQLRPVDVAIVPYGAAVTMEAKAPKVSGDEHIVLSVGRMIERKGFEYAVRAMPLVRQRFPSAHLYLVGGGPEEARLRALVEREGWQDAVTLTGKIPTAELDDLFARCSVFVLPSIVDSRGDTEGLGVVLLEAMMYRKPVVGSDVGGIPDIITDNETGLLVPQKDPQALSEAVCRVLGDQALARRLGDDGYACVRERFDWNRITEQLLSLYRGLMDDCRLMVDD